MLQKYFKGKYYNGPMDRLHQEGLLGKFLEGTYNYGSYIENNKYCKELLRYIQEMWEKDLYKEEKRKEEHDKKLNHKVVKILGWVKGE